MVEEKNPIKKENKETKTEYITDIGIKSDGSQIGFNYEIEIDLKKIEDKLKVKISKRKRAFANKVSIIYKNFLDGEVLGSDEFVISLTNENNDFPYFGIKTEDLDSNKLTGKDKIRYNKEKDINTKWELFIESDYVNNLYISFSEIINDIKKEAIEKVKKFQ